MTLVYSCIQSEIREIVLRDKPKQLLDISPKGTVPVLVLSDGSVLEESLDIIHWALQQNDPNDWSRVNQSSTQVEIEYLIKKNDIEFKANLDRYKYPNRFSDLSTEPGFHRQQCELFLRILETKLLDKQYLFGATISLADIAIFPFVRQCANVDMCWFTANFNQLSQWLDWHVNSVLFCSVMQKYPCWQEHAQITQLII